MKYPTFNMSELKSKFLIRALKIKYLVISVFSIKKVIPIIAWIPRSNLFKIRTNNWGDDVNFVLLRLITKHRPIPAQFRFSATKKESYAVIGSLIPWFIYDNTIVWGAGVKSPDLIYYRKPKKVLAVRGPLTRQNLIENGIDCPEIYGDPALLFPLYFYPKRKNVKKYKIGVVLHHKDLTNSSVLDLVKKLSEELSLCLINVASYGRWTNFIQDICDCEIIISSSLHGLIIADAYGVPNVWAKFQYEFGLGRFKFIDYFKSVHRDVTEPILVDDDIDIKRLYVNNYSNTKPYINILPLIDCCPFPNDIHEMYKEYVDHNKDSIFVN